MLLTAYREILFVKRGFVFESVKNYFTLIFVSCLWMRKKFDTKSQNKFDILSNMLKIVSVFKGSIAHRVTKI